MLAITAKVKTLKEEVKSATSVCKDLIGSLKSLDADSDYKTNIGIFAVQAPDWKILKDERQQMINLVRKVCTGELSPGDAIAMLEVAEKELAVLNAWLQVPTAYLPSK